MGAAAAAESPVSINTRKPRASQGSHGRSRIRPQRIARVEIRRSRTVHRHPQPRHARLRRGHIAGKLDEELAEECFIAQQALVTLHARRESTPGKNLHVLGRSPFEPPPVCRIENRVRQRMVRPLLRRCRHAQQFAL